MTKSQTVKLFKYIGDGFCLETIENSELHLFNYRDSNDPFELLSEKGTYLDDYYLLSLTGGFQKKLMWSMYSNSHKGVCLYVEIEKDLVSPIIYTSKRIDTTVDYKTFIKSKCYFVNKKSISFTKSSEESYSYYVKDSKWKDEKEYRCIFPKNSNRIYSAMKDNKTHFFFFVYVLKVYLGTNISKDNKKAIIRIAKQKNIEVHQMVLSEKQYGLTKKLIYSPKKTRKGNANCYPKPHRS